MINDKDILMTFNLELKNGHHSSIDIKKSIEKYYDLPIKNQIIYFEEGYEGNCCCGCNFYFEITKRCKKIIIRENNGIFSNFLKKSGNEVEIYQIFLRLRKNDFEFKQNNDLTLPKIINEERDDENKEENEEIDNNNKKSIINNIKIKINNEEKEEDEIEEEIEEEIGEQKIFRTIYTIGRNKYI